MNCSAYIFGNFGKGCTQYPYNYSARIFEKFQSIATDRSQIVIARDRSMMYYGYVRKLDRKGQYIGMCVQLNDMMLTRMEKLFTLFEGTFAELVSKAELIKLDGQGDIVAVVKKLNEKQQEVDRVTTHLRDEMSRFEQMAVKLPPPDFSKDRNSCKFFTYTDKNEIIVKASSKYAYTCIQKDEGFDTPLLVNLREMLTKSTGQQASSEPPQKPKVRNSSKMMFWMVAIVLSIVIAIIFIPNDFVPPKVPRINLLAVDTSVRNDGEVDEVIPTAVIDTLPPDSVVAEEYFRHNWFGHDGRSHRFVGKMIDGRKEGRIELRFRTNHDKNILNAVYKNLDTGDNILMQGSFIGNETLRFVGRDDPEDFIMSIAEHDGQFTGSAVKRGHYFIVEMTAQCNHR